MFYFNKHGLGSFKRVPATSGSVPWRQETVDLRISDNKLFLPMQNKLTNMGNEKELSASIHFLTKRVF